MMPAGVDLVFWGTRSETDLYIGTVLVHVLKYQTSKMEAVLGRGRNWLKG